LPGDSKSAIRGCVHTWKRLRQALTRAFALPPTSRPFTPDEIALLEKIAGAIAKRGMAAPALLFLESLGPLHFLGSQVMHGLKPFLDFVSDATEAERLAILLERRETIERLSTLLQERANLPP
jgi:hypothetical protein